MKICPYCRTPVSEDIFQCPRCRAQLLPLPGPAPSTSPFVPPPGLYPPSSERTEYEKGSTQVEKRPPAPRPKSGLVFGVLFFLMSIVFLIAVMYLYFISRWQKEKAQEDAKAKFYELVTEANLLLNQGDFASAENRFSRALAVENNPADKKVAERGLLLSRIWFGKL